MAVMTLSLFRFDRRRDRAWVFAQMGLARPALARTPGIGFHRLMGSGVGEGFTPRPNWSVWAILAAFRDSAAADSALGTGVVARWRTRATAAWSLVLAPRRVAGRWGGAPPVAEAPGPLTAPVAVLTRATIRLRRIRPFWGHAPAVSDQIGANPDVLFKIGLGEVPFRNQVTFSLWPDLASMARFAYRDAAHARAVAAVRQGGWFAEECYARFSVLDQRGAWPGVDLTPGGVLDPAGLPAPAA